VEVEIDSGIAVFTKQFEIQSVTFFITSIGHPSCSYAPGLNQAPISIVLTPPTP